MAETNHTSSATNNDRETSAPNVHPDAAQAREGLSRRNAMRMMTAAAAVPAIAMLPATSAVSLPTERAAWDAALNRFRKVEAQHDKLGNDWERAEEAADASTPERIDRYFKEFHLGIGMTRAQVIRTVGASIAVRDWVGRTVEATAEDFAALDKEAGSIADEFMAYQQKILDAKAHFRTEELYAAMKSHIPSFDAARDALMAVPAPDAAALLVKMEIAAVSLDDEHAESALADAKRLLAVTH